MALSIDSLTERDIAKVFYRSCSMSPGEHRRHDTLTCGEAVPAPMR